MKKNLSLLLAALLLGSSHMVFADTALKQTKEAPAQAQTEFLGFEKISQIRTGYEKGEYKTFLKEMDESYQNVLENGGLENLSSLRKEANFEWISSGKGLEKERNLKLQSLVSEDSQDFLSQKILSATKPFSAGEEEAYTFLSSLRYQMPQSSENSDLNTLVDLDLEYEYKLIHFASKDASLSSKREMQTALKMEMMDKMIQASQSFKDEKLKGFVQTASINLDQRLGKNWDQVDLFLLAKTQAKPESKLEEETVFILNSYQEKFMDLSKQLTEQAEVRVN